MQTKRIQQGKKFMSQYKLHGQNFPRCSVLYPYVVLELPPLDKTLDRSHLLDQTSEKLLKCDHTISLNGEPRALKLRTYIKGL